MVNNNNLATFQKAMAARQGNTPAAPSSSVTSDAQIDELLRGSGATNEGPVLDQILYPLKRMGAGFAQIAELPTGLYGLGDVGLRLALQTPHEVLPGGDAARAFTEDLDKSIYRAVGLPETASPFTTGSREDFLLELLGGFGIGGLARKATSAGSNALLRFADKTLALTTAPKSLLGKAAVGGGSYALGELLQHAPGVEQQQTLAKAMATRTLTQQQERGAPAEVFNSTMVGAAKNLGDKAYTLQKAMRGDTNNQIPTWMLVAGGVAGLGVGAKLINKPKLWELGEQFGANAEKNSVLSKMDLLNAALTDKNSPITKVLRDAGNEQAANFVDTTQVPGTLRSALDSLFTTGKLPEAPDIEMPKLIDITNKFQAIASSGRGEVLSEAIRAKDKYTYYRNHMPEGVGLGGESADDLKAIIAKGEADPELKQFMAEYKGFTDGMAKYLNRMGILNDEALQKYTSADYYYMPNIVKQGKKFTILDEFGPGSQNGLLTTPSQLLRRENAGVEGKLVDPIRALEQYAFSMTDFARQNKIRRDFVDTVRSVGEASENHLTGLVKPSTANTQNALAVFRNGKKEYYSVTNKVIRDALDFAPQQVEGVMKAMNVMRHGFQYLTTGPGNPLQAPASLLYDTVAASFLSPKPLGLMKGDVIGSTIAGLAGSYVGVKDRLYRSAASYLNYAMHNDTALKNVLGEDVLSRLSKRMGEAWANSTTAMMEKYGAGHGGLYRDDTMYQGMQSLLTDLTPEFVSKVPGAHRLYNLYTSVLDGIQNGARTAYFLRYGKREADYAKILKAAYDTRTLTGDFAKVGNSPWARSAIAMFPYFNPSVQSAKRIGQAFRKNPAATTSALTAGVLLPAAAATYAMSQASMAHRQWYWNELSPYERDAFVWLPSVDVTASMEQGHVVYKSPEESIGIPLVPEARPVAAMVRAMIDELSGAQDGLAQSELTRPHRDDAGLSSALSDFFNLPGGRNEQDITQGFAQMSPLGVPPALQALLAGGYGKAVPFGAFQMTDIAPSIYDETEAGARMRTALGSLMGWSGQFALSVGDAYRKAPSGSRVDAALSQADIQLGQKLPVVAGALFGYQRKLASSTVDSNIYHSKIGAITAIQKVLPTATMQLRGGFGPSAAPMNAVGSVPPIIGDPQTFQAMMMVSKMAPSINRLKVKVDQQQALIKYTRARTDINPKQKAMIINTATRRLHAAQNEVTKFIQSNVERPLQKQFGKQIMLEDLTKGLELDRLAPIEQPQGEASAY